MKKHILALVAALIVFPGCLQTIALRSMGGIMDNAFVAFNEEQDIQLAHEALGSNLKLLEALIKSDPENAQFLLFAAQGYNAYALAFCEDDSVERARVFYLRAKDYGMRVLLQNSAFREGMKGDDAAFAAGLKALSRDDVPALFWTAFSWGGYVNITLTDISALADLSRIQAMIARVIELDPAFYHGASYLFLGAVEGTTPKGLGGKPDKSREYFEEALKINGGKFLMTQLYYARTYAVQVQDRALFDSLLTAVVQAPADILPEAGLANAVAKQKARRLLSTADEQF